MRILGCGEHAFLVEFTDEAEVLPAAEAVRAARASASPGLLAAVDDLVPAQRTLLVTCARSTTTTLSAVAAAVRDTVVAAVVAAVRAEPRTPAKAAPILIVDVTYDGADLDDVARLTGRSREEVIAVHTGTVWTVTFCGFAPGFGYLRAAGDPLMVPRRPSPRTRVPAGSVALAGPYSGVYPTPSSGGWQLIGRTNAPLWDLERNPPALFEPGTQVRFADSTETEVG